MKMTQTQLNSFQANLSDRTNALVMDGQISACNQFSVSAVKCVTKRELTLIKRWHVLRVL